MAQSSRQDSAAVYRAHAAEARAEQTAAQSDDATLHHDHAAGHHETAARMMENIPRLRARATTYRTAANAARRQAPGVAAVYDDLAEAQDRAAIFSAERAAHHHNLGLGRSALGRERETAHRLVQQVDEPAEGAAELPVAETRFGRTRGAQTEVTA